MRNVVFFLVSTVRYLRTIWYSIVEVLFFKMIFCEILHSVLPSVGGSLAQTNYWYEPVQLTVLLVVY